MQRIGLFGGSFNPVHLGHLLVARSALEELDLGRLVFVPAAQSPFKPAAENAPASERLRLLRLALAGLLRMEIDAQEIERGGVSYTIDTLRKYSARFPSAELYYLIGADHVALLPKWREAAELAKLAHFVIISRPGTANVELPSPFHGSRLKGFPLEVSSSQIRDRIKAGQSVEELVGMHVAEAIRNNRLYL